MAYPLIILEDGSLRLTAFVYKSFAQAKRYIYIDDKIQSQTLIWLLSIQKSDGCFINHGKVFNNALKGEDNEISLTAYVINALLEAGHPVSFVAVQKGLQCTEAASRKRVLTTYDQALLAYTFSLVQYKDKREFFINELSKKAKKAGGSVYWELEERISMEGSSSFYYPQSSSANIETTSYGLLALLSKPRLTSEELSSASQVVQWVAKQQNSYGGFSSTKIKLLHPDNSPIPNEVIQLHLKDKIVGNYTTDTNGIAQFSLDTSKLTYPNITLKI
uniref:ovostatin-like n=1 Tax=Ictidomys tridecemlineatus TaxID=43179 RepID=UPI001A9D636A|nr:ovostatin-like [Ictidomys tridecemlineatus]